MTTIDRAAGHRGRLLQGMVSAVAEKGYGDVTIADVVASAGVSKRTFYEHFGSKQDCLLACYRDASTMMQAQLRERAASSEGRPGHRLRLVLDSYLAFLDRAPELARTVLTEIETAGVEGRRLRRETNLRMAQMLREVVNSSPEVPERFDLDQSVALVGGVSALVVMHAEDRPEEPFSALGPSVLRFVAAVLAGDRPSARSISRSDQAGSISPDS